jgi:ATP-dependent 26S proteasome regulatory subunit
LNLTDGLLNDILNIQIIATFNTKLSNIDKALLRPERLIARKEFSELSIERGKILAEKININPDLINKELTLADIYAFKNESKPITHNISEKSYDGKISGFTTKK